MKTVVRLSDVRSESKLVVLNSLLYLVEETECEILCNFPNANTDEKRFKEADRFIHRIRVDISRLKELVRKNNKTPKQFKIIVKNVRILKEGPQENKVVITILKTVSGYSKLANDIGSALDGLTQGDRING